MSHKLRFDVLRSGASGGALRSLVECPLEVIKVRRQVRVGWRVGHLLRGIGITGARNISVISLFWGFADMTRYVRVPYRRDVSRTSGLDFFSSSYVDRHAQLLVRKAPSSRDAFVIYRRRWMLDVRMVVNLSFGRNKESGSDGGTYNTEEGDRSAGRPDSCGRWAHASGSAGFSALLRGTSCWSFA